MHLKRLVVAAALLPALYFLIMRLNPLAFLVLTILVSGIAQNEFCSMYGARRAVRAGAVLGGSILLIVLSVRRDLFPDVIAALFIAAGTSRLFGKSDPASSLRDLAPVLTALLYIPCLLGFQLALRQTGPEWVLFLFGTVWASDSLAYYFGKGFGRRKLYESVSPNKTVAGAVGSLVGGAVAACLLGIALAKNADPVKIIPAGVVIGATTIVGDLAESMFKRDAGVKDSGVLIPGHGGILDKIDGVLFAGPVFRWFSRMIGLFA